MASTIETNLASWTAAIGTTKPAASDTADIDADLRTIQSVVRKYLASPGADIAASAAVDLSAATGNAVTITHATTTVAITSLGTVSAGMRFMLTFSVASGTLTMTHSATDLILPGGANISIASGDRAEFISLGSNKWRCLWYTPAAKYSAVERTWTAQQTPFGTSSTATTTQAWDCDVNGQIHFVQVGTTDFTMSNPTNVLSNTSYVLIIGQHAVTPRVITWGTKYLFPGGVEPVLTAAANAYDIFTFIGTTNDQMFCVGQAKALS